MYINRGLSRALKRRPDIISVELKVQISHCLSSCNVKGPLTFFFRRLDLNCLHVSNMVGHIMRSNSDRDEHIIKPIEPSPALVNYKAEIRHS